MNQIICDVCGAAYDETAQCCPTCGYSRQGQEKTAGPEQVKGGRFSIKNVKLRQAAAAAAAAEEPKEQDNRPLLIVIALLCVAIVLVSAYIALRFFRGREFVNPTTEPAGTTMPPVPCAGIVLDSTVVLLEYMGQEVPLGVTILPRDTTDQLTFVSTNEDVVVVTQNGLVTAVGSGQAEILITCGSESRVCTVVSWLKETEPVTEPSVPPETTLPVETTAPTEPPATEPKEDLPKGITLNQSDISLFNKGDTYQLKVKLNGKRLDPTLASWKTSDKSIATVQDGLVTVVGNGDVTITASFEGKSAKCIIRCSLKDTKWRINKTDVSIAVGESFLLKVKNGRGELAENVKWSVVGSGSIRLQQTAEGTQVTGKSKGDVTVTATIDGVKVQCIVRVG